MERSRSWLAAHADVGLALGLAAAAQLEWAVLTPRGDASTFGAAVGIIVPLSLAMTLPLAFRTGHPLAVAIVVNVANAAGAVATGYALSTFALWIAWLCATYSLVVRTDARGFAIGAAVVTVSYGVVTAGAPQVRAGVPFWLAATLLAMWVLRRVVRTRDERADTLAAHAALLERERELLAREAVLDERARIARELHDVVAHEVSMIVVQAGAERRVTAEDGSAKETLGSIERAGRHALGEMRRLLGLKLRADDGIPLAPAPSLRDVGTLVERVRAAGPDVRLEVVGDARQLSPGLDASAYRIVQEALTNTIKHAAASHVDVTVRYGAGALELDVRDDGAGGAGGAAANGGGHGLLGMRERAELYGGSLDAGPAPGGGFRVHALLPDRP